MLYGCNAPSTNINPKTQLSLKFFLCLLNSIQDTCVFSSPLVRTITISLMNWWIQPEGVIISKHVCLGAALLLCNFNFCMRHIQVSGKFTNNKISMKMKRQKKPGKYLSASMGLLHWQKKMNCSVSNWKDIKVHLGGTSLCVCEVCLKRFDSNEIEALQSTFSIWPENCHTDKICMKWKERKGKNMEKFIQLAS